MAGLPFSGALGAMYFPGIKSLVQGDIPFLDGEVPAANGVVTGRGLAKMYAALANGAESTESGSCRANWPAAWRASPAWCPT